MHSLEMNSPNSTHKQENLVTRKQYKHTNMTTTLVQSTYTHLATQIATTVKQLTFLEEERARIASLYPSHDTAEDCLVGFIGEKLLSELDNAIRSLKVCLDPVTDQLAQKLAEPVETQLGLGLWKEEALA